MKKSSFTDSQIMAGLKRVEVGLAVPEICSVQCRAVRCGRALFEILFKLVLDGWQHIFIIEAVLTF